MSLFSKRRAGATIPLRKLVNRKGRVHVQTYWVTPEEMAAHQAANASDTKSQHTDAEGYYLPERVALHTQIVQRIVRSCPKPATGEQPECVLLLGGAASGKSTVVNALGLSEGTGTLNADDIKDQLPEYGDGPGRNLRHSNVLTAANLVHEESSDISKVVLNTLIGDGRSFVYDAVLSNPQKADQLVNRLKGAGYRVRLVGVSLDTDEALGRAKLRALGNQQEGGNKPGNGRYVPEEILAHGHEGSVETFEHIRGKVDEAILYDNNVSWGQAPIRVLDNDGVYREDLYQKFKNKGGRDVKKGFNPFPGLFDELKALLSRKKVPVVVAESTLPNGLQTVRYEWQLRKALTESAAQRVLTVQQEFDEVEAKHVAFVKACEDELQKGVVDTSPLLDTVRTRFADAEMQFLTDLFAAHTLQKAATGQENAYGALFFESVCDELAGSGLVSKHGLLKALRINSHLVQQKRIDKHNRIVTRWVKPGTVAHFKKTLGIPREDMPQIESKHVPAFVEFMKGRGVQAHEGEVAVKDLLPTQLEMNPDKVASLLNADNLDHLRKRVLTSTEADGSSRLLDGHHRFAGLLMDSPDNRIEQVRFNLPMHKLLEHAREFPHTFYKTATEKGPTHRG